MKPLPGRLVLLGHPVSHSLSPRMQNAALGAAGIPLQYEALDVTAAGLPGVLDALRAQHGAGNVTIPHKDALATACDRLTGTARRTGAVNTFFHEGGTRVGENTDVAGFRALARRVLGNEPSGVLVGLIGAGGAAAAVCAAVESWPGSRVAVFARSPERGLRLAQRYPGLVTLMATAEAAAHEADIVVNATPVGLAGDERPLPVDVLRGDAAVMDLAYRAGETPWVRDARFSGRRAADGLEMLIAQGAHAFECWFGLAPDRDAMRGALIR